MGGGTVLLNISQMNGNQNQMTQLASLSVLADVTPLP